jgi:type III secretory pathway component EscS
VLNCSVWLPYAFFLEKKNWPLIISTLVGMSLGLISAITIIHP